MLWRFFHYIFSLTPLLMFNNEKGWYILWSYIISPLWLMPHQMERGDFGALPLEWVRIAGWGKLLSIGPHSQSWGACKLWMKQKTEEGEGRKDGFITKAAERWNRELDTMAASALQLPYDPCVNFGSAWCVLAGLRFETLAILWQECWSFIVSTDAHNRNTIHSIKC